MSGNGSGERVALYCRVSTEEQAKSGYSIPDQRRSLREYASREDLEVVDEITDDGYSGATRERPGLRRVTELAEAGRIGAAVAIKRDRWFRKRYYRLMLDEHLKEHGARLVALDDTGNKIGDGVLDDYAEFERDLLAERSRNGKLSKAREGKIVGGPQIAYGFVRAGDYYAVSEPEMEVVRRIFSETAAGKGIRTIRAGLEADGIPSPRSAGRWNRWFIKKAITADIYRPHTAAELREAGVAPGVVERLEGELHGIYRYEGIPAPVPHAGISRTTVERARAAVADNKAPSKAAGRFWELSGGIIRCGECGRYMQAHTTNPDGTKTYHYYRCPRIHEGAADRCTNTRKLRAEVAEQAVRDALRRVFEDTDYVKAKLCEFFDAQRREVGRGVDTEVLIARREKLEDEWSAYQRAYTAEAISLADLKARRAEVEAERGQIEEALAAAHNTQARLAALDDTERALAERVGSGYVLISYDDGESYEPTPEACRELYRDMGLLVAAYPGGELRLTWAAGEEIGLGRTEALRSGRSTLKTRRRPWTAS